MRRREKEQKEEFELGYKWGTSRYHQTSRSPSCCTGHKDANATRIGPGTGIWALPRQENENGFEWGDVSAVNEEA